MVKITVAFLLITIFAVSYSLPISSNDENAERIKREIIIGDNQTITGDVTSKLGDPDVVIGDRKSSNSKGHAGSIHQSTGFQFLIGFSCLYIIFTNFSLRKL